jgi:beclin 1
MSFVLLTESQVAPPGQAPPAKDQGRRDAKQLLQGKDEKEDASTESYEMQRITKLFEILSARSDIDHPICVECTDLLVEEMQKKLEITSRERDMYVNYLKQLQSDTPTDEEIRAQELALQKAKADEASALTELRRLEGEKATIDGELLALEEESRRLDVEEEAFWRSRNDFASKLSTFQNERDSINSKFDHDSRLLEKLQVYLPTSLWRLLAVIHILPSLQH